MTDTQALRAAIDANLDWFRNSGVMLPADGMWGVAERVAVTDGNQAIEKMMASFPAWTVHDGYCVIEQRRADCNFEAALLFLLSSSAFGRAADRRTAELLLDFLYFRSGLLFRNRELAPTVPEGAWQWSHIKQTPVPYFDDDAWCIFLPLAIARLAPELDARYDLKKWALRLAPEFCAAVHRSFGQSGTDDPKSWTDPEKVWFGNLYYPHWCSLAAMALAEVHRLDPRPEYAAEIRRIADHVDARIDRWDISEICYAMLGGAFARRALGDDFFAGHVARIGEALLRRQNPANGNFPSEHDEAPLGPNKVDTIYTANWALLALQCAAGSTGDARYTAAADRLIKLLLDIQDRSPQPQFRGCWRGMYDLDTRSWGGGDCYEGGAGSIYTGWTNAPIAAALLLRLDGKSLLDL